jgi:hypothetical protein
MTLQTIATKRYVRLDNPLNDYLFINGDQINVTSYNPTLDPNIKIVDGIHTIISAATNYVILDIVVPIGGVLPTTYGDVEFADKRKVKQITTIDDANIYQATNITLPFYDGTSNSFKNYDWRQYSSSYHAATITGFPTFIAKPITSIGNNHIINKYERPQINLQLYNYKFGPLIVTTTTLDGTTAITKNYNLPTYISAPQFTNVSIPIYLIPGFEDKDVIITFECYNISSEVMMTIFNPITLRASQKCPINTYVLQFMDRMGAMSTFSFPGRAYKNGNVTRKDYNQQVENYSTSAYQSPGSRTVKQIPLNTYIYTEDYSYFGNRNINIDDKVEMELNTLNERWNDSQNKMWGELISSPYVYLIENGDYNNRISVSIKTNNYDIDSFTNKRLVSKKIKIEYANQNKVNI